MKAQLLLPIFAIAASITARAQSPNIPPPPPPQGPGDAQRHGPGPQADRREQFHKMAEQFRHHRGPGGPGQQQGNSQERAEHISEAMKHLKAAGLGQMADRIEEMLKKQRLDGPGRGQTPPGSRQARPGQPQRPPGPPRPPGPMGSFSRPAPFAPGGGPGSQGAPGARPNAGGNDDLRAQVQTLARQVEELRNMIGRRMAEHQGGPREGEHHDAKPGPKGDQPQRRPQGGDEQKTRRPQGDQPQAKPPGGDEQRTRRPQGDQPQARPQGGGENPERRPQGDQPPRPPGDGPRRENRDAPPQPKRDGAEQIKPALLPQSDSIE